MLLRMVIKTTKRAWRCLNKKRGYVILTEKLIKETNEKMTELYLVKDVKVKGGTMRI